VSLKFVRMLKIATCIIFNLIFVISFQNCAKPFKSQVDINSEQLPGSGSLPSTAPTPPSQYYSGSLPNIPAPVYPSAAVPSTLAGSGVEVYPGCELPQSSYLRTLYFDPVNGNDISGNGTVSNPYAKLSTFISSKLIKEGDHLILLKGDHGLINASAGNLPAMAQAKSWIWIDGQPGSILRQISLQGMVRWLITGVDVTGVSATQGGSVDEVAVTNSSNIVFAKSKIYPAADSSSWSFSDWMLVNTAIFSRNSQCTSFYQNVIRNVRFGIIMESSLATYPSNSLKSLAKLNIIDGFSADGMRVIGSDIFVQRNLIQNVYLSETIGDANHDDGIQGYALNGSVFVNLYVDGNIIQESTDPNRAFNSELQGVGIFDGLYKNVVAVNNVIIASTYHGISLFGIEGGLVEHNTLASPINRSFWISVPNSKPDPLTGVITPPKNVVVKNNIVAAMGTLDGNTVSTNNVIVTNEVLNFVKFDVSTYVFDFHLLPSSPIYRSGAGAY